MFKDLVKRLRAVEPGTNVRGGPEVGRIVYWRDWDEPDMVFIGFYTDSGFYLPLAETTMKALERRARREK